MHTRKLPTVEFKPGLRVFLVGIGGSSMAGLAEISQSLALIVAGSDRHANLRTRRLTAQGVQVYDHHDGAWVDAFRPDLLVHSAAVHPDNPEWARARELGIPVVDRAVFLGWINRLYPRVINIAGTHGKTTTTAMCAAILVQAGVDPTVHLGADLAAFGSSVRLGKPGGVMVSEACEYMRSFLQFYSTTAAVLNIDFDHVDSYRDLDEVIAAFVSFARLTPPDGNLVVPAFDPGVQTLLARLADEERPEVVKGGTTTPAQPRLVSFGMPEDRLLGKPPTVVCENLHYLNGLPRFDVYISGEFYATIALGIPGEHNVKNALAAIACAWLNGGTPAAAAQALADYTGTEGRFDFRGKYRGATVISDYAHHPAAARATLAAAATIPHQHIWVVFQPLTFSRTRVLFDDFVAALLPCEYVLFAEIYSDRETETSGMSSRLLAEAINARGGHAEFAADFPAIRARLDQRVAPGDLILVLGPEDIREFANWLVARE